MGRIGGEIKIKTSLTSWKKQHTLTEKKATEKKTEEISSFYICL